MQQTFVLVFKSKIKNCFEYLLPIVGDFDINKKNNDICN